VDSTGDRHNLPPIEREAEKVGLAEDVRQAAGQKADELRSAAQDKAQELRGAAESAWSGARSKAKSWQSEGEVNVRDNPTKAALIALGFGLLLGLSLRK
jgi:ElaB/YqjD/DUF883 family membrane-anchored ribosome-binding protein